MKIFNFLNKKDVVPAIKILTLEIDDYKKKENEKLKEKESLIKKNYPDSFDQRSKYVIKNNFL